MIFATPQLTGKDDVSYINGLWEWHCPSGISKKHPRNALYLNNTENRHFDPIIEFLNFIIKVLVIQFCSKCMLFSCIISVNVLCLEYFYVFHFMFHYTIVI